MTGTEELLDLPTRKEFAYGNPALAEFLLKVPTFDTLISKLYPDPYTPSLLDIGSNNGEFTTGMSRLHANRLRHITASDISMAYLQSGYYYDQLVARGVHIEQLDILHPKQLTHVPDIITANAPVPYSAATDQGFFPKEFFHFVSTYIKRPGLAIVVPYPHDDYRKIDELIAKAGISAEMLQSPAAIVKRQILRDYPYSNMTSEWQNRDFRPMYIVAYGKQ